ncbi:hypothetical protein ACWEK5_15305 [Rhodococcus koreensis]
MFQRATDTTGAGHVLDESQVAEDAPPRRPWRELLMSTPGRLTLLGALLISATLVAGVVPSVSVGARQQQIQTLRGHTEPLAVAAQSLYSSLSIADAAATTSFISTDADPTTLLHTYNQALADASAALVVAGTGVDPQNRDAVQQLTDISRHLGVYAGLISTARANDNAGNPIGVAYLGDASALMQDTVLPMAHTLYSDQIRAVADTQTRTEQLPTAALATTIVVLALLVLAQLYLVRKTHRRLNPALLAATALVAVIALWVGTAGLVSSTAGARARVEGTEPLSAIASAGILAQQARADETLSLLQRGSDSRPEVDYTAHTAALAHLLAQTPPGSAAATPVAAANAELERWRHAHTRQQQALDRGDYQGAARIAVGSGADDSAAAFDDLTTHIQEAITALREEAVNATTESYRALSALSDGAVALSVLAALAVGAGVWPRVNEYH